MLIAPETFLLFLGAVMILLITPGPNMAFVLTSGAAYGWRGGVAAAIGIGVVDLIFTLICAFGLAGLLSAYPAAFDAIRWAGAAYLIYLAVTCIRTVGREKTSGTIAAEPSRWAIFVRGLASNIANPKAILFFLVFIPQFIDARHGSVFAQFVALGLALAVIGTVFHGSLGAIGAAGAALAGSSAKRKRGLHYLQAAVFLLIAGRLLLG
jgi:threonine/homoserine/homoserine lactone efflux protein